jgi:hypothetical protein
MIIQLLHRKPVVWSLDVVAPLPFVVSTVWPGCLSAKSTVVVAV